MPLNGLTKRNHCCAQRYEISYQFSCFSGNATPKEVSGLLQKGTLKQSHYAIPALCTCSQDSVEPRHSTLEGLLSSLLSANNLAYKTCPPPGSLLSAAQPLQCPLFGPQNPEYLQDSRGIDCPCLHTVGQHVLPGYPLPGYSANC